MTKKLYSLLGIGTLMFSLSATTPAFALHSSSSASMPKNTSTKSINQVKKIYTNIINENFTSWKNTIFERAFPNSGSAKIENNILFLTNSMEGEVHTPPIHLEVGKNYRILMKNVQGSLFLESFVPDGPIFDQFIEGTGHDMFYEFTNDHSSLSFSLRGNPNASLTGFKLESLD